MPAQQPENYEEIIAEDITEQVVGGFMASSTRKLIFNAAREGFRKGIAEAVAELETCAHEVAYESERPILGVLKDELDKITTRGPFAHAEAVEARRRTELGLPMPSERYIVPTDLLAGIEPPAARPAEPASSSQNEEVAALPIRRAS